MTEVPRFKRVILAPSVFQQTAAQKSGHREGTAFQRGYGKKWSKTSDGFRRRHPMCEWCAQEGREGQDCVTAFTDHIIPREIRPDLFWVRENWWALCVSCHGKKKAMENYAVEHGLVDLLPTWCRDPESRPMQFRPIVRGM